jgi:hypothetical protein
MPDTTAERPFMMQPRRWWLYKISKFLLVFALFVLVIGFVVLALWNALIPALFSGPELTYWQAVGLLLLSHILFRGFGRIPYRGRLDSLRRRFEEKLAAMTPTEREAFKQEWKERCGWYPGMTEEKQSAGKETI